VALLSELADKLNDYCQAGFVVGDRPVSSEEMGEFDYALAKARAWAAMAQSSAGERPSYRAIVNLMDTYEAFVRDADQYRLAHLRDPARLAADRQLRSRMGSAGSADVLAFSHDAWAEGFSRALASLGLARGRW